MSGLRRSAAFAAALSFFVPGLGQGFSGAFLRGALLASPIALLVVAAFLLLGQGSARLVGLLLDPAVVIGLVILDAVLLLYRAATIVDAYLVQRRLHPVDASSRTSRAISVGVLVALLGATLSMHAAFGMVAMKTYSADAKLFSAYGPDGGVGELPSAVPGGSGGGPSSTPGPTPVPMAPWKADGRLTVLLVGGDAGPGRWSLRTDTMVLASVDIATGRAAMFGIPRNLSNVPLGAESANAFACRCFPGLLNALYVYAGQHPASFPGGEARGYLALQSAVSALTGVQVDGTLVVALNGFVRLVNALGGIDIYVPAPVYDPRYPLENGSGDVPLYIRAGQQHMNGHLALAYARSRHQDDDYHRMGRQQAVLLALRRAIKPCSLIPRLPELIDIAGDSLWTNFSPHDMPDILGLVQWVNPAKVARFAFDPPAIPEYLTAMGVARAQAMVASAFSTAGTGASRSTRASATAQPTVAATATTDPGSGGC